MLKLSTLLATVGLVAMLSAPSAALAWGGSGHRMVGQAAMQGLPAGLPAFLRTAKAVDDVGELSREPDRRKGMGKPHDADREQWHFIDIMDDGKILGGLDLDALPLTTEDYETALRAVGTNSWKAGKLPYSIIDGEQQLIRDFSTWRALKILIPRERNRARRAWMVADLGRREALIMLAIGELSHWVGDGAQPLHVSIHYNGWGDFPNPNGYTTARIHAAFEGELVSRSVRLGAVRQAMGPARGADGPLEARVVAYLRETSAQLGPLYELEKAGGFKPDDPRGAAFATQRLAAGASELRDLIVEAWAGSAKVTVGWSPVSLSDIASGKADGYRALYGKD